MSTDITLTVNPSNGESESMSFHVAGDLTLAQANTHGYNALTDTEY